MKKAFAITLLTVVFLTAAVSAQAQWWKFGRGGGRGAGPGWRSDFSGLNLTDTQQKQLDNLYQSYRKEVATLYNKMGQKQLELNSMLIEPNPEQSRVTALQKEISDLQAALNEKRVNYQLEARKILTPGQIEQLPVGCAFGFNSMIGGYGPGFGCGMGPGPWCGQGPGYGFRGRGYGPRCWNW